MKVLVTGGTGFVGREIVRQLLEAGHEVHVLARGNRAPSSTENGSIHWHQGDVLDSGSLGTMCSGMDAVIHLVGIISEAGRSTFEAVHVKGSRSMVAAAKEAGIKRFVHISALGTRAEARARYHRSKWEAEEIVRGSGLDWTIFRPSIIYGPGDGFVNLFAKIIRRSPIVPIIGSGESKFQPVPVAAVAKAFVKSLNESRAIGQTFDLCGCETLTLNQIVEEIMGVMRRKRWKIHIPIGMAKVQAAVLELLFAKICRRPSPLTRDQIVMLQEDNIGNDRMANELFSLQSPPFGEGIAKYLKQD